MEVITKATEDLTRIVIKLVGVFNGVVLQDSDIDEEMITVLAQDIRINAMPAISYAKARQEDEHCAE